MEKWAKDFIEKGNKNFASFDKDFKEVDARMDRHRSTLNNIESSITRLVARVEALETEKAVHKVQLDQQVTLIAEVRLLDKFRLAELKGFV